MFTGSVGPLEVFFLLARSRFLGSFTGLGAAVHCWHRALQYQYFLNDTVSKQDLQRYFLPPSNLVAVLKTVCYALVVKRSIKMNGIVVRRKISGPYHFDKPNGRQQPFHN